MPRNPVSRMSTRLARLAAVADRPGPRRRRRPGPAAALPRAPRRLQPRRRPRRAPGARARARRLRLLPAGAVVEPDLLRRRRREAPRSAMQPALGPALRLRAARAVAAIRAAAGRRTAAAPTAASCPGRWRAACSTSCRASGWCSTSTASTAPARGSASTAISICARRLHEKVKIPRRFVGLTDPRTTVSPAELMQRLHGRQPEAQARHDRRAVRRRRQPPQGGAHLLRQGRRLPRLRAQREPGQAVLAPTACMCRPCASAPTASGADLETARTARSLRIARDLRCHPTRCPAPGASGGCSWRV